MKGSRVNGIFVSEALFHYSKRDDESVQSTAICSPTSTSCPSALRIADRTAADLRDCESDTRDDRSSGVECPTIG